MGILILLGLAWAVYLAIRVVVAFIKLRIKAKPVTKAQSAPLPNEPSWAGLDAPTFIRRGIAFPVLTEKKKKRIRKAKTVDTPACVN